MIRYVIEPDTAIQTTIFKGEVALDNVSITGGTITGITDLAVADGGTGASTASAARTNLDAQEDLSGAVITSATVASNDKVLIQDVSASDALRTVTVSSVAALATPTAIQVDGTPVSTSTPTLDFDGADFLLTESPTDDFDITIKDSGIDHNALTNYVANQHINWTAATDNFKTTGTITKGTSGTVTLGATVVTPDIHSNIDGRVFLTNQSHNDTSAGASTTFHFARSRGSIATPTIVQSGDSIGKFFAIGYDGSVYQNAAGIDFQSAGTPGAGDMPGKILLQTTPDGSNTLATAVTVNSDQNVDFANGVDVTGNITVTGTVDGRDIAADGTTIDNLLLPQYVTLATTGTLTNERALTGGIGISLTDAGAGSTVTIDTNLNYVTAHLSANQTLTHNTVTQIQLNSIDLDSNSDFDATTNYRWTPDVAGLYYVVGQVRYAASATPNAGQVRINKNGANIFIFNGTQSTATGVAVSGALLVEMNGSTDYLELFGFQNTGSDLDAIGASTLNTFLAGWLVTKA